MSQVTQTTDLISNTGVWGAHAAADHIFSPSFWHFLCCVILFIFYFPLSFFGVEEGMVSIHLWFFYVLLFFSCSIAWYCFCYDSTYIFDLKTIYSFEIWESWEYMKGIEENALFPWIVFQTTFNLSKSWCLFVKCRKMQHKQEVNCNKAV
jgi:hypothetical protein